MRFLQPQYLYIFPLLAVVFFLWLYRLSRRHAARDRLAGGPPQKKLSSPSSLIGEISLFALANLTVAALILALAQPQWVRRVMLPESKKMDIVFIVDTSPSMRADDIRPSRLDRALDVIADFCDKKQPQDRIALVAFTSGSIILSYLTDDAANIRYYLDYLRRDKVTRLGTNIGHALNSGLKVLAKEYEVNRGAMDNKRVFILISDGEDHGAELEGAVASVKKTGIKIHTIAIGSAQGAPIPIAWEEDKVRYVLDANGNRIMSRLDERTLRWIADETGGGESRAVTGEELPHMLTQIVKQEREIVSFKQAVEYRDVYQPLLFAAFGFFLTKILIRGARV